MYILLQIKPVYLWPYILHMKQIFFNDIIFGVNSKSVQAMNLNFFCKTCRSVVENRW